MNILVTGAAGFIGYYTANKLLGEGHRVLGLDVVNDYYTVGLKYDRLAQLGIRKENIREKQIVTSQTRENFRFLKADIADRSLVSTVFEAESFDAVIHLAAQAGVRYSLENPHAYADSNITGFLNILEGCRHHPVEHLIYASSSSVYGANTNLPFSVKHNVDHPVSLYAASKKANELMAHTYSHLYGVPVTGLRFFTVYGPWGRPDMAYFKFADLMTSGKSIDVYNHGEMERDFTYVDDIIESIARLLPLPPEGNSEWNGDRPDPATSFAPYQLFNIGNNNPVRLMDFITEIERNLGIEAKKNFMEIQPGDVPKTWADVSDLFEYTGYKPQIGIREGIANFVTWYREYYRK
ncbi:NAD-dependent epimerase [Balneolales bacterium ANBcel1]|nr:NAD-dependent epimerase [Balneolales bacterium ANBcel1]